MVTPRQAHRLPQRSVLEAYTPVTAATYTAKAGDRLIGVNRSGVVTVTLPSAQVNAGRLFTIKDESGDASTNNITVATEGSETIDGAATNVIDNDYGAKHFYSDGTNWFAVPVVTAVVAAASTTVAGKIELATIAETSTGSATDRAITPDGLAGSDVLGGRTIQIIVFDFGVDLATGDGKFYFHIDERLAGMNIVDVHAEVITAGTTGTTDIQLHNLTAAADILSTKLTIDSGETGSDTAAAAAVINASEDDLTLNDLIRVDVDAVSTTAPKGLIVTIGCRLP